jgi:mycobactin peptide synthetase MbtF
VCEHASGPRLTAYVAAEPAPAVSELRVMLAKRLPRYMVPHRIIVVDEMPLTSHGKVDEAALAAMPAAAEPAAALPETPTETALVELLCEILQSEQIDVDADFLRLGLDSIVALSVVQAARRRGISLRARLMLECATIRELAEAIDSESVGIGPVDDDGGGPITLLSNARWLYEYGEPRRLAQTDAIRLPDGVTTEQVHTLLRTIVDGHEVLRSRLDRDTMTLVEHESSVVLTEAAVTGDLHDVVAGHARRSLDRLDPERGALLDAVWLGEAGVLLLTVHALAGDPASWRIMLGELDAGLHALAQGRNPAAVREHTSYRRWSRLLTERAQRLDSCDYWVAQVAGDDPDLGARRVRPQTDRVGDVAVTVSTTAPEVSVRLLDGGRPITHLLAAAAARMVNQWRLHRGQPRPAPLLALETHGRADIVTADADTSDTVGLLSAIYPLRVPSAHARDIGDAIDAVPGDGIDYGLLRYLRSDTAERLRAHPEPQLLLNFLGRIDFGVSGEELRLDRSLLSGVSVLPEPDAAVRFELTINALVLTDGDSPVLATQWRALPDILTETDIAVLQSMWQDALAEVAQ